MKILCLNVMNGGVLKDDLVVFLQKYINDIDIFCFQEVEDPFRDISPLLSRFTEIHESKRTGVEQFNQSIFVNTSIPVTASGVLLKEEEDIGLGIWIALQHNSAVLTLCNYHGMARPGDKNDNPRRLLASETLVSFARTSMPTVVMGDFNLRETTESVALFERHGFRNLIKEYNIQTTRNHHIWDKFPDNKQMYSDYVFVSPEVIVRHFEVLPDIVSDHQPLLLDIE